MTDVAKKIGEIPQQHRDVASIGTAFSPSGDELAVEGEPGVINVWDWRNKRLKSTLHKTQGAGEYLSLDPLIYSNDGQFLAACHSKAARDVVIRVWETQNWQVVADITEPSSGGCNAIAFTADGLQLIHANDALTHTSKLVATSVGTWQNAWSLPLDAFTPKSIAISPKGAWLAVSGYVAKVTNPEAPPGDRHLAFSAVIYFVDLDRGAVARQARINACGPMAWSPDGARLAIVGASGVEILDASSGGSLVQDGLDGKAAHMNVRFTPDGRYFIETDMNGQGTGLGVEIWDGDRKQLLQKIRGNPESLAVSRDGKYLATGDAGHTTIWALQQ